MSRKQRISFVVLAVAILVLALLVLRPTDKKRVDKTVLATIHVRGGQPAGGVQRIKAVKGQRLLLTVDSDGFRGEVHFHGYDKHADLAPGAPARFNLALTQDGGFVVELEQPGTEIADVEVAP